VDVAVKPRPFFYLFLFTVLKYIKTYKDFATLDKKLHRLNIKAVSNPVPTMASFPTHLSAGSRYLENMLTFLFLRHMII